MHYRIDLLTMSLHHRQRSSYNDHFKSVHSPDLEIEPTRFETNARSGPGLVRTGSSSSLNSGVRLRSDSPSSLMPAFKSSSKTSLSPTLTTKKFDVVVHEVELNDGISFNSSAKSFGVSLDDKPDDLIKAYFRTKLLRTSPGMSSIELDAVLEDYRNIYVLNVCGSKEIMFGTENTLGFYKVLICFLKYFKCQFKTKILFIYLFVKLLNVIQNYLII
jgi:hypothetical protein